MSGQLTLGLSLPEDSTFDNFYPGRNLELVNLLRTVAGGRGDQYVYFWGAPSSGRTHLLHASCHLAHSLGLGAIYLPLNDVVKQGNVGVFEDLESLNLVCLDDIQAIAGKREWEEAFFHFYNRIHDSGRRFIISGDHKPVNLGMGLNDVISRLSWGLVFNLEALNDDERLQAMSLRAQTRGLDMPENVAAFLLKHCQRDMSSLFKILETLDEESLAAQRKLTIPFVKQALNI